MVVGVFVMSPYFFALLICRPLRGLGLVLGSVPQARAAIAWACMGGHSPRQLRRLVRPLVNLNSLIA